MHNTTADTVATTTSANTKATSWTNQLHKPRPPTELHLAGYNSEKAVAKVTGLEDHLTLLHMSGDPFPRQGGDGIQLKILDVGHNMVSGRARAEVTLQSQG